MSESGDYNPGPWKGYDFKAARNAYDVHVGRSYSDAQSTGKKVSSVLEKEVSTNCAAPLVIACDVTGSMGAWPATIFSKLPLLELEGQEYLGKDMEISFAAIGDAYSDKYPLQVRPFTKGTDLATRLKELVIEGNGGGQTNESYDLAALYFARNASMPSAIKPIFVFIGDEGLYDFVDKEHAKTFCDQTLEKRLFTKDIMEELKSKFSVYLVRKKYGEDTTDTRDKTNSKIQSQWEEMLGDDHVCILPEAGRVVDVIFGILAKETGRDDYFKKEITERQKPEQVRTVMKTLESLHPSQAKKNDNGKSGNSITKRDGEAAESKSLL